MKTVSPSFPKIILVSSVLLSSSKLTKVASVEIAIAISGFSRTFVVAIM